MHKLFLTVTSSLLLLVCTQAQTLVSATLKRSWTTQQIDSFYTAQGLPSAILPQQYAVDIYQVIYNTVSYDGVTPTVASGLMVLPKNKDCASPILSYQHGTVLKRTDAPSNLTGEYVIGVAMAADGYVGLIPDYLGLGASSGIHPYVHANSEATAVADMIRATREACDDLNFDLNGQIFLTGYSQGGHATMAAHRYLVEEFPAEFNVVASVPMSGPYSLSEVMRDLILSDVPYSNPAYLPMVIMTYRTVYNIYPNLSDAILPPFDTNLPIWTDGTYSSGYVDNQMNTLGANPPKSIIKPAVLDTFTNDSTHVLRVLLKQNDVYRWVPQQPMRLLYCKADEQVSYLNTMKAYQYMTNAGAPNISIRDVDSTLDHFSCAQFALLDMRSFFKPMRHDILSLGIGTYQSASGPGSPTGSVTLVLEGGAAPVTVSWSNGQTGLTGTGLAPGTYTVTATGADGCSTAITVNMNYTMGIEENMKADAVGIYPNPANDVLYLNNLNGEYSISDLSGRTIKAGTAQGEKVSIAIADLLPGTYLFQAGKFRQVFIKQ